MIARSLAELAEGPLSETRERLYSPVLPLPVLLDVERDGALHTLLITIEGQTFRVGEDGALAPWPGELGEDELAIAKERLCRAALDRMGRA